MAAAAQVVSDPVEPRPQFWAGGGCRGQAQAPRTLPYPVHIIDVATEHAADLMLVQDATTQVVDKKYRWELPADGTTVQWIDSWYVPPDFVVAFLRDDPHKYTWAEQSAYKVYSGNQLVISACTQKLTLDGPTITGVMTFHKYQADLDAICYDQITGYNARYVMVFRKRSFHDKLMGMCTANERLALLDAPMHLAWQPQEGGCDQLLTQYCATHMDARECRCFRQQQQLHHTYGRGANVPVCCFGQHGRLQDQERACAYDALAYKTAAMTKGCCTVNQCRTALNGLDPKSSLAQTLRCYEEEIQLPSVDAEAVAARPDAPRQEQQAKPTADVTSRFVETQSFTVWAYMMAAIPMALLLTFVVLLALA